MVALAYGRTEKSRNGHPVQTIKPFVNKRKDKGGDGKGVEDWFHASICFARVARFNSRVTLTLK